MVTLGLARLHLPPEAVWALTPRELVLALGHGRPAFSPLRRVTLDALMAAYPDGDPHGGPDPQ